MHLDHISIKNFRIFKSLELDLNPGLNVLVGENDSGKTALIDAIRLVLGENSFDRSYINESDFHDQEKELFIQLRFAEVAQHAHVFVEHLTFEEVTADKNKRLAVLYVQLTAKNSGLERRGYPLITTEIKTGRDGNGLSLDTEIRAFLSTTYLKPLRDAEVELSAGRGSRLSQILNSSKDLIKPESVDNLLRLIADTNKKLVDEGEPIHRTSKKIQDEYLHELIFEKDKAFLKAIIDIAGVKDIDGLTTEKKRKYVRIILEGLNLSLTSEPRKHGLGYNNLLFMAAELLLLEQELDSEFPLLLIEEPEAHLHPQLQMKLLRFITSKSKSKENQRGIQCILSTHSPNISSKADPNNIIVLNQGKAFPLTSEETELDSKNYSFLAKFLDVTKANLFFSRGVILVEGDAENILIPSIATLLGRPIEDYGVSIVNIGNTGWKHFAKLFLRKGKDEVPNEWNTVKVAVVRDLDLWPVCAQENDINRYGFVKFKPKEGGKLGNVWRWLDVDEARQKEQIAARASSLKNDISEDNKSTLEKQNVKVFVSDYWTLEYCLSRFGLFDECYEALMGSLNGKDQITGTDDEKATYVQREVENSKTDFATALALLLEKNYIDKPDELKNKLPSYLVSAIEHVTQPLVGGKLESEAINNDAS